jgi:AraC-like DNA-binding protein
LEQLVTKKSSKAIFEKLNPDQGHSIRVFSWQKNLADVAVHLKSGKMLRYEGFGNSWHYHPEIELNLLLEGKGLLFVGDYVGYFEAPDAILLGSNLPHYWKASGDVKGIAVQFLASKGSVLWAVPEFASLQALFYSSSQGLRFSGQILKSLSQRMLGLPDKMPLQRLAAFLDLLDELNQSSEDERVCLSRQPMSLSTDNQAAVSRVIDTLLLKFAQDLSLQDALELSGLSRATFHRHFKAATGSTFNSYLNAIRLQEARRLLLDSKESITRIAFDTGFRNLSHFNAMFKRQFACSPSDLRLRYKESGI